MNINPNWMFVPTLVLAVLTYVAGNLITRRIAGSATRCLLLFVFALLGIPAILYTVYYLHLFDDWIGFYQLRSLPGSELFAAGIGFLPGALAQLLKNNKILSFLSRTMAIALMVIWLLIPYVKTILYSTDIAGFDDRWIQDVCIQSTPSSCGPASAATILRAAGRPATERTLAEESFTSRTGTENWYLARALRRRGFSVEYKDLGRPPVTVPYPSIAGTRMGGPDGAGHFIAVLSETDTHYVIGDPLRGRVRLHKDSFNDKYYFTGFFMVVKIDK